jgi:hypothetical protein
MAIVSLETGFSPTGAVVGKSTYRITTLLILTITTGVIGLAYASVSPSLGVVDVLVPQIVQINGP